MADYLEKVEDEIKQYIVVNFGNEHYGIDSTGIF